MSLAIIRPHGRFRSCQLSRSNRPKGSYWITTFGCQMNKADSERMAGILESMGYEQASAELNADLVLYNTCTIRDNAEQKVYSYLGRQAQRKRTNPGLTLVVAGCVAQQEGASCSDECPSLIWSWVLSTPTGWKHFSSR